MNRHKYRLRDNEGQLLKDNSYVLAQDGSLIFSITGEHLEGVTIEWCTGREDIQDDLVYESDVIEIISDDESNGDKYYVKYSEKEVQLKLQGLGDNDYHVPDFDSPTILWNKFKIVGTIYDKGMMNTEKECVK